MNKKEKNKISKDLKRSFDALDEINPLPEKLSRENIDELLKTNAHTEAAAGVLPQRVPFKKIAMRTVALAAAIALLFGGGQFFDWYNKRAGIIPDTSSAGEMTIGKAKTAPLASSLKTAGSYEELYEWINAYKEYGREFFMGGGLGGDIVEDNADFAGAERDAEAPQLTGSENAEKSDNHGETNTQVKGVDEADVVKNDGQYIYSAYNVDNYYDRGDVPELYSPDRSLYDETYYGNMPYLRIINAYNATGMSEASKIDFTDVPPLTGEKNYRMTSRSVSEFFLQENMLYVVLLEEYTGANRYSPYSQITRVAVYDISDRAEPHFVKVFSHDGSYLTSRITNNRLVFISQYYIYTNMGNSVDDLAYIPSTYLNNDAEKLPCDSIFMIENASKEYLVVSSINLANLEEKPVTVSLLGGGSDAYCTADSLYVPHDRYAEDMDLLKAVQEQYNRGDIAYYDAMSMVVPHRYTEIFCFDLTGGVSFRTSGTVSGTPLNQFSMDEYNGYFRIATTGNNDKMETVNNVYILDGNLKTVGSVTGLAEGESIQSVRFMGDVAYVVTFKQVDPLFVIDLKAPTSPKVLSELKIPGFSRYLHPVGDGLLLGTGVAADPQTGRSTGGKVSLFDVSNPYDPKESDNFEFPDEYLSDYSHKAFMVIKNANSYGVLTQRDFLDMQEGYKTIVSLRMFTVSDGRLIEGRVFETELLHDGSYYSYPYPRATYIEDTAYVIVSAYVVAFDMNTGEMLAELK